MPGGSHYTTLPGCHPRKGPRSGAAVKWREGWQVKTIEHSISLSGSTDAKNSERIESIFPGGLVGLPRVAEVLPV
jgi:hypothetical protein